MIFKLILVSLVIFIIILILFLLYKSYPSLQKLKSEQNELPLPAEGVTPTPYPTFPPEPTQVIQRQNYPSSQPTLPVLNKDNIFNLINDYRRSNNKLPFTLSEELCKLATEKATLLVNNNPEDIKESTSSSISFQQQTLSYSGKALGENIVVEAKSDQEVLDSWKASPPHNQILLLIQKHGVNMTRACVTTLVKGSRSSVVLLVGDK